MPYIKAIQLLALSLFCIFLSNIAYSHTPHDVIHYLELHPQFGSNGNILAIVRNNLLKSIDGGNSWKRIVNGLDNRDNGFSSLKIADQIEGKTVYLSTRGDGVYKSIDGGSAWFRINNGLDLLNIATLDCASETTIFAADVEGGLYRTKDGGENWKHLTGALNKITVIQSLDLDGDWLLVGNSVGQLFITTDSGDNWKKIFELADRSALTTLIITPDYTKNRTFFVGSESNGVYKTTDGGKSFTEENSGLLDKNITSLAASPNFTSDKTLYASTWHKSVFCSNNAGETWKQCSSGLTTDSQASRIKKPNFRDIRVSNNFAHDRTLFVSGFDGLFRSKSGGSSWQSISTLPLSLIISFDISPNYEVDSTIAVSTYVKGAYLSHDKGATWEEHNNGLKGDLITQLRKLYHGDKKIVRLNTIAFSPDYAADKSIFSAKRQELLRSLDKGDSWNSIYAIDLKQDDRADRPFSWSVELLAFSPKFKTDNTIYFATRRGGVFKSTTKDMDFSMVWPGLKNKKVLSFVVSPNYPIDKTLFVSVAGGESIYKTIDAGKTWLPAGEGLDLTNKGVKLAISPNYGVDTTMFAGTVNGLFKTTDGGDSWLQLKGKTFGDDSLIEEVAVSPSYSFDKTLITSIRGKGLFKSTDEGDTFIAVGKDLIINNHLFASAWSFRPTSMIKFSPSFIKDKTIYGATAEALFKSTDSGTSWEILNIE